ncbi:MAG: SRPBCC family protein [Gaiellaceae bacterium]
MGEATITRTFDAPRERVWQAFTEPADLAAWFGTPPYTTPAETVTIELRPGGAFRATMVHEGDGSELPFVGHYVEVDEPARLVQILENPVDPDDPQHETLTYTLVDLGDGRTAATYHQQGHLPDEQYPLIEHGVNGFWDRLEAHLAT